MDIRRIGFFGRETEKLLTALESVLIEEFIYSSCDFPVCPPQTLTAIARAFVAKMVHTPCALLNKLEADSALRRIFGWERKNSKEYKVRWTAYKLYIDVADTSP